METSELGDRCERKYRWQLFIMIQKLFLTPSPLPQKGPTIETTGTRMTCIKMTPVDTSKTGTAPLPVARHRPPGSCDKRMLEVFLSGFLAAFVTTVVAIVQYHWQPYL